MFCVIMIFVFLNFYLLFLCCSSVCLELFFFCVNIMSNCVIIYYPFRKPTFQQKSLQDMNLTRPLRFVSVLTVHLYKLSPFQTFILPNQSILLLTPGNVKINVGLPQTFVLYMLTITVESCSRNKNERTT